MKHYADEKNSKSEPRYSAKSTGGKRYAAPENKTRYEGRYTRDRIENKPSEPRVKYSGPRVSDETKIYPVKKADVAKLEKSAKRPRTDVPATPTAPVPKMKLGYAPAFLFAGFILVMMGWFIFNTASYFANGTEKEFSPSEKRILADFPKVLSDDSDSKSFSENLADGYKTIAGGDFGKGFETFFADHFPVRNLWVGTNAYATLYEGNNGANGVYYCGDGYLINKPVPEDNKISDNLEMLTDFKSEIGSTPMTAMFVPSTGYIVSDKLPLIHNTYNDDKYLDKINSTLNSAGVGTVDLRDSFKTAHNNGDQLYYKTDHHWTTRGAYVAYRQLCNKLGIEATPESEFNIEKYENFYGTTYSKGGFWFRNSMFFYEHDKDDDKYPIFIDGNHAYTEITNKNAKNGTIIVVKDSFSHCMAPFLAENYKKVILVDMRYNSLDITALAQREKPEQVLVLYGIDNFAEDTDLGHLWG